MAHSQLGSKYSHIVRQQKKEERKKQIVKAYSCKKVVYENCRMLAPDGTCLSNCDRKKAQWYVDRELATVVAEDPFSVKLNFEPSNRQRCRESGEEDLDDEYYVANRANACVRCGQQEDYSRFFIIPSMYRTHLPDELKSHRSHDIVLMCFGCHDLASRAQDQLKQQLAEQFNAPLTDFMPNKSKHIVIQHLLRASSTLAKVGDRMPEEKKDDLKQSIVDLLVQNESLLGHETVPARLFQDAKEGTFTDELFATVSNLKQIKLTNKDKQNPHG